MKEKKQQYQNEFEQPLTDETLEKFNTLQGFSYQATSFLDTTLADTLSLSMHNAVSNQQQSQMTTAASITNACARLLQTQTISSDVSSDVVESSSDKATPTNMMNSENIIEEEPSPKGKFSLLRFLKRNKKEDGADEV